MQGPNEPDDIRNLYIKASPDVLRASLNRQPHSSQHLSCLGEHSCWTAWARQTHTINSSTHAENFRNKRVLSESGNWVVGHVGIEDTLRYLSLPAI